MAWSRWWKRQRKEESRRRKRPTRPTTRWIKEDKKIHQFVPFTSHNASTHHTYSDTKEHFVHAASIKLGEYANDVRSALETEVPYVGTKPTRQQAARLKTTMPNSKISRREDEKDAEYEARQDAVQVKINKHLQEKAQHDDMSEYQKRANVYQRNITRAFDLLISQYCSSVIKEHLEQEFDYRTAVKDDPIEALKRIKVLAHNPARGRYHYACIYESIERFVNIQQQDKESTTAYLDRFEQNMDVMESYLPMPIIDSYVEGTAEYKAIADPADKLEHKKQERDAFLAYVFVRRSNQKMYGSLMRKWNGEFAQQRDEYPKRLEQAKDMLNQHKSDAIEEQKLMNKVAAKSGQKGDRRKADDNEGSEAQQQDTSFAQKSNDKFCYCCGSQDHLSFDCSKKNTPKDQWYVNKMHSHLQHTSEQTSEKGNTDDIPDKLRSDDTKSTMSATSATRTWYDSPPPRTGETHCQIDLDAIEYMLLQNGNRILIRDQIILDTGSTMDLFCNLRLLEGDPYLVDHPIEMATNAGYKVHRHQGRVLGFPEPVWYDPTAITNIMSLKTLRKHHNIAYDAAEDEFIVSLNGMAVATFKSNDKGLYVYTPKFHRDCDDDNEQCHHHRSNDPGDEGMNFLETVRENARFYTRWQLQDAKRARELYHILGAPSVPMYKSMLQMNVIKNCPVTTEHVDIAEKIFGTDVSTLKGKTTRKTPPRVLLDTVDVPKELYILNQELELCIDGMFVNERAFITSIDKTIHFRCAITIPTTSDEELFNAIDAILHQYKSAGFTIVTIHADRQFERIFTQVKDDLGVTMNYPPAQAHIPDHLLLFYICNNVDT